MTKVTGKRQTNPKRKSTTGSAGATKRKTSTTASANKSGVAKPKSNPAKPKQSKSRENSKANKILALLQRKGGAAIAEMTKATGWQPHSVRGFLSGTVKKRLGHNLKSEKASDGVRRYHFGATR